MSTDRNQDPSRLRILALDVGTRRIGIAVSDSLGITAQGLDTLRRTNKRSDFAMLSKLIKKHSISEIVVGNPLRMSGEASSQSEKVNLFVNELRKRTDLPVHLWDERLSSAQANRLLDETGHTRLQRKGVVDQMAAVLILQAFMESREVGRD